MINLQLTPYFLFILGCFITDQADQSSAAVPVDMKTAGSDFTRRRVETVNDSWTEMDEDESYTARHECSFVQAGDKFYLFGGRESPTKLEIYDFTSNTWSQGANVPYPLNHFQAIEYEGLIFVIGAFQTNSFPKEEPAKHVYVYDPANDVWMEGPRIPHPRGAGGVVIYNHTFYMLGGNTIGHAGGFVGWLDEYNPATGEWNRLPDAPHSRDHFHAAVVGNKLYAAGGRRTSTDNILKETVPEVDVYDFASGAWLNTSLPENLPAPRAGTATVVFDGRVFVMGGESSQNQRAHDDVHALNLTSGAWSAMASLNHGRHGTQAIVSGKGIYIAAGSPKRKGGRQQYMEVYNQDAPFGEKSTAGTLLASRTHDDLDARNVTVTLQHAGVGNQGVFVTSMEVSGSSDSVKVQFNSPFLIPRNGSFSVTLWNESSIQTKAWLDIMYSGNQKLSVPLHKESESSNISLPETSDPQEAHELRINSLILVDESSNNDISSVNKCSMCVNSRSSVNIRAEPKQGEQIHHVELSLKGPQLDIIRNERSPPYSIFGDSNGKYKGRMLDAGKYTISAQAFSFDGKSGPLFRNNFTVEQS